jgi:pseudouridine-5'-monophosphatase
MILSDIYVSDTETFYLHVATELCKCFGRTFTLELREKVMGLPGPDYSRTIVETLNLPVLPEEYYACSRQEIKKLFPSAKLMPGIKCNQFHYTF